MATEGDKLEYKDLISPDGSINELISQLEQLSKSYGAMVSGIKVGAKSISISMKQLKSTTSEARAEIDEAAAAADRLERAEKELKFAMSDIGKELAWVKAQTADINKSTVAHNRQVEALAGSYDKIKLELEDNVKLWKSLSDSEKASADMGGQVLNTIHNLTAKITEMNAQLKPTIAKLTEVQKAEQKLAYLQSDEGQKLIELKRQINDILSGRRAEKVEIDKVAKAQNELTNAKSEETIKLIELNRQKNEAIRIAKLTAQINSSEIGSYNQLAAQYELNKIKLNAMSQAERNAAESGKALEAETLQLYKRMVALQEATGNHKLSVGNYTKAFDGLRFSVFQIVREIPAATVNMQTFFLAISNNLPVLADEIARMNAKNKAAIANGGKAVSIAKQIGKALFSWNTLLVIASTLLITHGKRVTEWVSNLTKGKNAVISLNEAQDNVAKELETNSGSYGSSIVALKKLSSEYKNLKTVSEKNQWIKDNASEFDKLGISVNNITDAENVFVKNTKAVIDALKLRAKATAAQELASKKYTEALLKSDKAAVEKNKGVSFIDKAVSYGSIAPSGPGVSGYQQVDSKGAVTPEEAFDARIKRLEKEAEVAEATGDAYFDLAAGFEATAKAKLKAAGIDSPHKKGKETGRTPRERDLTDAVNRMALSVQKKYEESLTQLEREEYAKRIKEATDNANAKIRELQETYRKNVDYLNDEENKYKELTEEEKKLIEEAQQRIRETITNTQDQLTYELEQIEKDRQIGELKIVDETIRLRLDAVKKGSAEELQLRLEAAKTAQQIALLENSKKPMSQQQKPEDITAGFTKQQTTTTAQFDMTTFDQQQELDEAIFNEAKHNETEKTRFKLEQEKARWQRQIELAKAGGLDWSQAQIDAAEATVRGIDRELSELDSFIANIGKKGLGTTLLENLGFNDDAIDALTEATNVVLENIQSIVKAEIEAAEAAVEAAEARVDAAQKAYDAEIEARNNGYANNATTAQKELLLEKKRQRDKQKLLEDAQRRQEAINTITQSSSLITASANIWSSLSSVPIIGPALALAAIGTMWTSFAAAKIKARQVTAAASEEYGDGGLEFLEGGSHASGNDIDLGTTNRRNKRMRAEGGEAMAIINKRSTRRYKKILPDIVDSLNKGLFEDKYLNAFDSASRAGLTIINSTRTDLTKIENDVRAIKKQNETRYSNLPDGSMLVQYKNIKRIIRHT